jgi:HK97 family phage major capsid protein
MGLALDDGGSDLRECEIVMRPRTALYLSTLKTSGGALAYPDINVGGGKLLGFRVRTSPGARTVGSPQEGVIALVDPSQILVADEGRTDISASQRVAIQASDTPGSGAQQLVSLFQTGAVGVKFARYINWQRTKDTAVSYARVTF